ncbi:hypothetical protein [Segatella copri]|uniref:hypothetical protein n=1 Tax=Segatella copri TaxID=165179 RepID=UPI0012927431|nr:hypothetical protein [Segatella copri]MQN15096.1 hypothetical protein [Segatella copri]MQN20429.1 hypothetical protein [Segatella copri]
MATRQEVILKGLTHSPSDYDCQDGELATCLNLINEDGALHPIHQPVVAEQNITLDAGDTIELVHKVTHNETIHSHYIIRKSDDTWYWMEKGGDGTKNTIDLNGFHVNAVTAVGNIVNFVGEISIKYLYWIDDNYELFDRDNFNYGINIGFNDYDYKGGAAEFSLGDEFWDYVTYESSSSGRKITGMNVNQVSKVFNMFDAVINKTLSDKGKQWQKYFVFGVAAIRLYDGTYYSISNIFKLGWNDSTLSSVSVDPYNKRLWSIGPVIAAWTISANIDNLDKISNLIQGIDIFLSKAESFVNLESAAAKYVVPELNDRDQGDMFFTMMSGKEAANAIDSLSFYHSLFISKDEFGKELQLKRVEGTEESLPLANLYRSDLGGKCAITYNNRLHVGNVKEGYNVDLISNITPNRANVEELKTEGIVRVKASNKEFWCNVDDLGARLYYFVCVPILNVSEITFYLKTGTSLFEKSTVNLHSSETTAFSFYVAGEGKENVPQFALPWEKSSEEEWNNIVSKYENYKTNTNALPYSSVVKVSEAENPLIFPAKNSVQVGSSIINALAANTRPISEGQFGDAPLYAFTDEGVWVLMLGEEGTYIARQPANRDICSNPKGILQIDDAVLFPTERGIMMQRGRESECITDVLDDYPFDFLSIYSHSTKDKTYPNKLLALGNIPESDVKYVRFRKYLEEAGMIYDYYDSRIIVFNPNYTYAYVYSLKSNMWGTMHNVFNKRVNIYPESYATDKEGKILDVYVKEPTENVPFFLCSRPLTLGQDAYKTMFDCITRGYFSSIQAGKCGMVLFGSNDLVNWYYVGSSVNMYLRNLVGSPYKYFRLALMGNLAPKESISALSTEFQSRLQNKLR